jgi:hypothetical protein
MLAFIGGVITIALVAWFWFGKTWDEWDGYDDKHYR